MNWKSICLVAFHLFVVSASPAQASIVINELHPQPTSGVDWFELYNPDSEPVDLSQWVVEDHLSSPSVIKTFELGTILEPEAYLVIEVGTKLNNSGDGVTLKDLNQNVIDSFHYFSAEAGQSWARLPDSNVSWYLTSPTAASANGNPPSPTPSASPQPSPTPSPSPTLSPSPSASPMPTYPFSLSEVLACPSSSQSEWLELYNPSDQTYELENWVVMDRTNVARIVSGVIPTHGYGILSWSGSLLNNTGDGLTLLTDEGVVLLQTNLPACQAGQSHVWDQNQWRLTTTVTPGTANPALITPSPSPTPMTELSAFTPDFSPLASPTPTFGQTQPQPAKLAPPDWSKYQIQIMATPAANLSITPPFDSETEPHKLPFTAIIGAIMGGSCCLIASAVCLYDYCSHLTPLANPTLDLA